MFHNMVIVVEGGQDDLCNMVFVQLANNDRFPRGCLIRRL